MMLNPRRAAALLGAALILAACGSGPTSGTVVDRTHTDAYTKTTTTSTCTSRNKDGVCRAYMPQTSTRRVQAEWKLLIQPGSDPNERGWRTVTEDVYNRQPIGSHYDCECGE